MADSDGLAQLLSEYRQEGSLNSEGVFTVDLAKALPKLEKFQLPEPHFGLLKVVQSAIASDANKVWVRISPTTLAIEHDGNPPKLKALRELLSYLMAKDHPVEDRILRDLAIGVNTTLARGSSWVEVCIREEGGWARQRWLARDDAQADEELRALASQSEARVRFAMRRSMMGAASEVIGLAKRDFKGLLTGSRDAMDSDARAIYDRCRYAPATIHINGRKIPSGGFGERVMRRWSPFYLREHRKPNLIDVYLVDEQTSPHLMDSPVGSEATYKYIQPVTFGKDGLKTAGPLQLWKANEQLHRRCWGWLGMRQRFNVPFTAALVKDGVHLTSLAPEQLSLPEGLSCLLVAEGLPLDLSQFRLVKSEPLLERLNWISNTLARVAGRLINDGLKVSPEQRKHLNLIARTSS